MIPFLTSTWLRLGLEVHVPVRVHMPYRAGIAHHADAGVGDMAAYRGGRFPRALEAHLVARLQVADVQLPTLGIDHQVEQGGTHRRYLPAQLGCGCGGIDLEHIVVGQLELYLAGPVGARLVQPSVAGLFYNQPGSGRRDAVLVATRMWFLARHRQGIDGGGAIARHERPGIHPRTRYRGAHTPPAESGARGVGRPHPPR